MTLKDLPEIQVSRHASAKNLRLRVDAHSIRLTVPHFSSAAQIQQFIDQSTPWLLETWQKQQAKLAQVNQKPSTSLKLFNVNQNIAVEYAEQRCAAYFDPDILQLSLDQHAPELALKEFIKAYAKRHLPTYLAQIAKECGIEYQGCKIRAAKTRWGSCSARHDIMLNAALVLCPPELVRYVCVHELAHTRHFDHSPQFWAEVEKHDPDYQQHRKGLKNIKLPYWYVY